MGSSTSHRKGPQWTGRNTPGANPKVSKGAVVKAEGTHMSGATDEGRKGMPAKARSKSMSGRKPAKNTGPHGYS